MLFGAPSIEQLIAAVIALLVGLTFHEFSHALLADTLGDHRPRAMGRLTLNPIAHLDPIGALLLVVAGFGWAKPVLVNPYALRNGRMGMAIVAAAGPVSNVLIAFAFAVVHRVLTIVGLDESGFVLGVVELIVVLNLVLAILNILPIPPLDGYNVALAFLPPRQAMTLRQYAPYGAIVLLILVLLPGSPLRLLLGMARPIANVLIGA
jgi:Zn-dependent protease